MQLFLLSPVSHVGNFLISFVKVKKAAAFSFTPPPLFYTFLPWVIVEERHLFA
jgi:hypothetical protein